MSVSFVPARHCRRTISAAFTSVTHFIQFVVNLEGPTYDTGKEPVSAGLGAGRGSMDTLRLQDTAGSPSRARAQTRRSFFIAPYASLRPC